MDIDSVFHRMDPCTKLIIMLMSFSVAVMYKNIIVPGAVMMFIILCGSRGRVLSNLTRIRGVLIMITVFSLTIWAIARDAR